VVRGPGAPSPFQSYLSPIQTTGRRVPGATSSTFNPTLVQFKPAAIAGGRDALHRAFNPTLVQFKRLQVTLKPDATQLSILP